MSDFHAELEQLVLNWYERATEHREKGFTNRYHAYRQCADQLAKTLEEHDAYQPSVSDGELEELDIDPERIPDEPGVPDAPWFDSDA